MNKETVASSLIESINKTLQEHYDVEIEEDTSIYDDFDDDLEEYDLDDLENDDDEDY